ncbi:MAG: polyamine aminopropyltransferase [Deltaproteobacteria bacterium]|nr:polyamine aminopropyltransferase [Deltaproteobacteria bacterium]
MALWYDEVHDDAMRFGLKCERTLFMGRSDYQKVAVIETTTFGRALLLDDLWMTSERDEHVYHELIAHAACSVVPQLRRVLVIGGGDGGTAREVLRHPEVERVDLVEIDGLVVETSKQYLGAIGSAWDDPRLHVTIGDGIAYVREAVIEAPYDVVIVDGSDPTGPAVGLFDEAFYRGCRRVMGERAVFITQSESPFVQRDVHLAMIRTIASVFGEAHPLYGTVPLYPSGSWSWTWACTGGVDRHAVVPERAARIEASSKYWNRDIQRGAFAVPNHIKRALAS